jgi:putative hemolysin
MVNVLFTSSLTTLILSTTLPRQQAEVYATASSFVVLLLMGEVMPKTIACHKPLGILRISVAPLFFWYRAVRPLSYVLTQTNSLFNNWFPPEEDMHQVSSEDIISSAVREGEETGSISVEAGQKIRNIFATDNTPIRKVMTPRSMVSAVEESRTVSDAAQIMIRTGYSRIPVYEGRLDLLKGMVYMKDLLMFHGEDVPVAEITRPILRVDATDSVDKVLRQLRSEQLHMAAVYNSDKRLVGIVSIEDLLEEIVGEIVDEHDAFVAGEGS